MSITSCAIFAARRSFCALDFPGQSFTMMCGIATAPSSFDFVEDALGNRQGGICRRPAGIEGQMRDDFDQLLAADAVLQRFLQMERKLVDAIERNQACDRYQAAVPRR